MKKYYNNLNMIVCVGYNNIIGDKNPTGNGLLWHVKEELLFFKNTTLGHTLLVGENTAKYIPLDLMRKNREVIVLENNIDIESLLKKLKDEEKTVFICGGYSIYCYFLENYSINKIYLSKLKDNVEVKKALNPLYLPKLEDYAYVISQKKEYENFISYIYEKGE